MSERVKEQSCQQFCRPDRQNQKKQLFVAHRCLVGRTKRSAVPAIAGPLPEQRCAWSSLPGIKHRRRIIPPVLNRPDDAARCGIPGLILMSPGESRSWIPVSPATDSLRDLGSHRPLLVVPVQSATATLQRDSASSAMGQ